MHSVERSEPQAVIDGAIPARPTHATLLCALEAGSASQEPFLTFADTSTELAASTLTLRELRDGAHRYARLFLRHGITGGERVLLLLPTGSSFIEAMLGAMLAGAVPVPLAGSFTFGSKTRHLENLSRIAVNADARVLVTTARMRDALSSVPQLQAQLRHVVTPEALSGLAPGPCALPSASGSDTAFIQYTSGTTGRPKGVVISQRALMANACAIKQGLELNSNTVGVSWLPLFHDMGLVGVVLTAIAHPYRLHLLPPEKFLLRPRRWLEVLSSVAGTLTVGPNFAYELCVARAGTTEGLDLSPLRTVLNGAEPVRESTLERFAKHCAPAGLRADATVPVYGLAEATLAVAFCELDQPLNTTQVDRVALETQHVARAAQGVGARSIVSVGRPVAGTRCEIHGPRGQLLAEREVGEIRVRSPSLMDGYFRDDTASSEALRGGTLCTGDLGFIAQGRLFVTGRKKDLIIKGGRNIHPDDVERVAEGVPGLRMGGIAAFAQSNAETGTDNLVVAAETTERDQSAIERLSREVRGEVLAVLGVKVDTLHFCRVGGLPRTTSGKISRSACATRFVVEGESGGLI